MIYDKRKYKLIECVNPKNIFRELITLKGSFLSNGDFKIYKKRI